MIEETSIEAIVETPLSIRGSAPLDTYYEIDRITQEIIEIRNKPKDGQLLRVAVQFPDELLNDSPEVCWLLEEKLCQTLDDAAPTTPLVFCLGDTTVASCCADEVAALHLQADVLVHYGHTCLNPTGTLPVIYSFGMLEMNISSAVQSIVQQQNNPFPPKILLLYQVGYHHAMKEFQRKLSEQRSTHVIAGAIPKPRMTTNVKQTQQESSSCCGNKQRTSCCQQEPESACLAPVVPKSTQSSSLSSSSLSSSSSSPDDIPRQRRTLIVGGLELPESITSWDDLSEYTILFVGDSESTSQRQYTNIMLRFLSLSNPPEDYWTYSPKSQSLITSLPPYLQRQLKRRFFLSQKARDSQIYGILVSNLSQQHLVDVVKSLKRRIDDANKSSYSFAVGKINPAKLANFAEIECFVLVACREHSLLSDEREYHVPVITPLELEIALDNLTWGAQSYTLDCQDVLDFIPQEKKANDGESDEDDDAPYFSLVTGKYTQRNTSSSFTPMDLENLPGRGQVTEYKSEAANFLKQREYQGLATMAGQTKAKAAVPGQRGIASNYDGS
jgi:diphthamide biosynthesis protein 2